MSLLIFFRCYRQVPILRGFVLGRRPCPRALRRPSPAPGRDSGPPRTLSGGRIEDLRGWVLIAAQERQKRGESWDFGLAARGSRLGAATKSSLNL
ncbi:hypothetical protein CASFOL_026520 [Castilleja foliolosa]|uniref:Uncharacterized protein n=1 Tax=Castilleja foliolosa TaxID=1961234 RepID=A0ABD3CI54_9LAMI